MMEYALVGLIVSLAIVYLVRRILPLKGKTTTSCGSCPSKGCGAPSSVAQNDIHAPFEV